MPILSRVCVALASGALLVLAAGCAPAEQPPALTATSASPSVTPSVSASEEVLPLAGGNCEQLLDPAAVAIDLGGSSDSNLGTRWLALARAGGIGCSFYFGVEGAEDAGEVSVSVVPAAIAEVGEVEASLISETCAPAGTDLHQRNSGCGAVANIAGWWYSLSVHRSDSAEAQQASFRAIRSKLESALHAAGRPEGPTLMDPFDCESADTGGLNVTSAQKTPVPAESILAAAYRVAGPVTCTFISNDGGQWDLDVYPAAAWLYDQCTNFPFVDASRKPTVLIAGVELASQRWWEGDTAELCATDGMSLVTLRHQFADFDGTVRWDEASLATASLLLVPVFAAAD